MNIHLSIANISALKLATYVTEHTLKRANYCRYLWTFKRTLTPPIQEPRESPYIVGPYLKPDYLPTKYITDPINDDDRNDDDHKIYKPTHVKEDEERKVKLLLLKDVEGLGISGEIIDAPYRYGASKLVSMGKAEYATEFNVKWFKFGPRTTVSASSALSPITIRNLRDKIFNLHIAEGVEIQPWHIVLGLRLAGVMCPLYAVKADTLERYLENRKEHVKCTVVVNNHEQVTVRFKLPVKKTENKDAFEEYEDEDEDED